MKLEGGSLMCLYHGNKPDEGEGRIRDYAVCVQGGAVVLSKKLLLFAGDRKVILSLPYKLSWFGAIKSKQRRED